MTLTLPRLLAGALVAFALVPAAAAGQAGAGLPVPASDAQMSAAHDLAVARWGAEPCGGQVTVSWAHMGRAINAHSQWMSLDAHDATTYSDCSITYNLDIQWDWPKLCTVVEHELGHLDGHEHVDDPHNVMSPYYVYPTSECAGARAPSSGTASPATTAETRRKAAKRKATKRNVTKRKAKASARHAKGKTRAKRSGR